jgi:RecB family exonuclease
MPLPVDAATGLVPWHQSMLTSVLKCGEAFRRRYIEREILAATTPQIRGSAVHRAVATGLGQQMRAQMSAPIDLYQDVAATEIERARHGGATFTAEEASQGPALTWGRLKDHAVRYAGTYGQHVAPTVQPVAIEQQITLAGVIPGVLLRGTIDLVDAPAPTLRRVIDTKTTERRPHADTADRSQQLSMYDLLDAGAHGASEAPRQVALDYLVLKPSTGDVEPVRLYSWRSPATRRMIVRRLETAIHAVNAGTFLPANPDDWWCAPKWCAYFHTCPYVEGQATLRV